MSLFEVVCLKIQQTRRNLYSTSCIQYAFSFFCLEVYGAGGSYNVFSGKDASRAIAKWSMSPEDLNDNLVRTTAVRVCSAVTSYLFIKYLKYPKNFSWSRVAQRKRAGPITQRSEDQNLALLNLFSFFFFFVPYIIPFFIYPSFFNLSSSNDCFFFLFKFQIQDDLSEADLKRLDDIYKKLYVAKYPKVGYVEGHEPQHEDNLTVKRKKNIEL